MTKYHVAIVGGGIAGLYAALRLRDAWRLQRHTLEKKLGITDDRPLTVALLERNPLVLGGRIRSAELPFPGGSVRAELGAMRITTRHLLARHLFTRLGVQTRPFEGEGLVEHFHLRGKHFNARDIEESDPSKFPYAVDEHEKGKGPGALVEQVLESTLRELSLDDLATPEMLLILERLRSRTARETLTHAEWTTIQERGLLPGNVHLKNIGMWNLIHHYLSPEAASFVEGGFGYESIIGNWNVSDAIPWFIADFDPAQRYEAVDGSFFDVIERLERAIQAARDDFECHILYGARVGAVVQEENHSYRLALAEPKSGELTVNGPGEVIAQSVILALPRLALEGLEMRLQSQSLEQWTANLASVRSHRLVKIAQAYRKPWWRGDARPGSVLRTYTDLPLRQVYYYDREWLEEHGRYRDEDGSVLRGRRPEIEGLAVAYLDGHHAAFWRFITAVQRAHTSGTTLPREEQKREWFGDRKWEWPEPDLEALLRIPVSQWSPRERVMYLYFNRYGLYERASAKVRHTLEFMHKPQLAARGMRVPEPVAGAYTFWDDFSDDSLAGAGWHTWEPGIRSEEIINYMIRPFGNARIHVCGEAYSNEQGWIEGALKSVERMLYEFGILLPDETIDPDANHRAKQKSAAMLNHVGVPARGPDGASSPLYSTHRKVTVGDSDLIFLAGQIGLEPNADDLPLSFEAEAKNALDALLAEVQTAAGPAADLISVSVCLASMSDYDAFNRVYDQRIRGLSQKPPVRTAIAVRTLPKNARVEVDGIAVVRHKS